MVSNLRGSEDGENDSKVNGASRWVSNMAENDLITAQGNSRVCNAGIR